MADLRGTPRSGGSRKQRVGNQQHDRAAADPGDPEELGELYADLLARLVWLNVFGSCCGSDLQHVTSIARSVSRTKTLTAAA